MNIGSSSQSAWGAHIDGAVALVKLRGIRGMQSSLSRTMFWFLRKGVVSLPDVSRMHNADVVMTGSGPHADMPTN